MGCGKVHWFAIPCREPLCGVHGKDVVYSQTSGVWPELVPWNALSAQVASPPVAIRNLEPALDVPVVAPVSRIIPLINVSTARRAHQSSSLKLGTERPSAYLALCRKFPHVSAKSSAPYILKTFRTFIGTSFRIRIPRFGDSLPAKIAHPHIPSHSLPDATKKTIRHT